MRSSSTFRSIVLFLHSSTIVLMWECKLRSSSPSLSQITSFPLKYKTIYLSEVESSRTSLASRTHFEVLGLKGQVLGLEASSPRKLASPRLEDSTIFWNRLCHWICRSIVWQKIHAIKVSVNNKLSHYVNTCCVRSTKLISIFKMLLLNSSTCDLPIRWPSG